MAGQGKEIKKGNTYLVPFLFQRKSDKWINESNPENELKSNKNPFSLISAMKRVHNFVRKELRNLRQIF